MTRAALWCALGLALIPCGLAGQRPALDSLAARARRLETALAQARRAEDAARARELSRPPDTLRSGYLTVLVSPGDAPRAADGVRLAGDRIGAMLGDAAILLDGEAFQIAFGMGTSGGGGRVPIIGVSDSVSPQEIADAIVRWAGPMLATRGSPELRAWSAVPVNVNPERLLREAHIDLVTAIPGASARCIGGSLQDCAVALGIRLPEDPATTYWDSAGRYEMVSRARRGYIESPALRTIANDCLTNRRDRACTEFLRGMMSGQPALALAPLGTAARQSLMYEALHRGGPGAIARLLADTTASLEASLAAAGGPFDSLLAGWRQAVLAARPDTRLAAGTRVTALIWALVFAGMALGGTRWRAG